MTGFEPVTLDALVADVPDGARIGVPADYSGVPVAATKALIRRGARGLRLFCLPSSTLQADMLIGAGCVAEVEAAAVTLGEHGLAPRFTEAVQSGAIIMRDSTCPALHAQLQAAVKGQPFATLRGVIGSDIARFRDDWKVIDNPFAANDPVLAMPAVTLDVSILHAEAVDEEGNLWIGRRREVATLAQASKRAVFTVERRERGSFFESERRAAGALAAIYAERVAVVERGAAPCGLTDVYPPDAAALSAYARAARAQAGFDAWAAEAIYGGADAAAA